MSSKKKTTATKEDAKPTLVPKLRFPKFREAEGWKIEPLRQLADYENGKAYEQDITESGKYVVVNSRFISTDGAVRKYTNADYLIAKSGEVLMVLSDLPKGRALAKCYYVEADDRYAVNQRICRLKPHRIEGKFLYYTLNRHPNLLAFDDGLSQTHLSKSGVNECPLCVPSEKEEQQKIAECLSSVDELMALQSRKVDALKTHKKGLMQQLFPREGETQPRLRFPEFQNAGEWKAKRLEDLAKRGSGHTPSKSYPEYYNGGIKWISLADSKRLDCGLISETAIEISEQGIRKSSAVLHPEGTVLISRDAGIGKSAVMGQSMAVSQHFIVWTCNTLLLSNWFLYHLLQNSKPVFDRAATGSTIKTIGLQFFIDLEFHVPSLPEQQRIADCLTSLDDLIAAQTQKLEALKTHKKALMQQLFPSPEVA